MEIHGENIGAAGKNEIGTQNNYFGGKPQGLPNSIPSISGFVGREDYLADLRESYQKGSRCFVLHGIAGVGKSALALQFAGEIAKEYEAKVFVEMNGMSENPLSAKDAMFDIVRQFDRTILSDISDAQLKNLFVQFVQNQPTLIVLDNAASQESVEVLKQAKACFITTSRESFVLTDGESKPIIKMSPEDARELLFRNGGGENRFAGRADELAELAGYLPMALKPLASILREDELETAADLIERYRDKKALLKERVPDYDNLTVEASFELSYDKLSGVMKEHWRHLSVFPSDFDEAAIASVLKISPEEASETQKQLRRFSLLEVNPKTRRFNLHDLIRVFTDAKLLTEERFRTQFLHSKYYASIPQIIHEIKLGDDKNGYINALNLLDVEWNNIIVGQKWAANLIEQNEGESIIYQKIVFLRSGKLVDQKEVFSKLCLAYSGSGRELLKLRLHPLENIEWLKSSSTAARILNDQTCIANNSRSLGIAYKDIGENGKSLSCFNQALIINRKNEDWESICGVLNSLGNLYISSGKYLDAEECC